VKLINKAESLGEVKAKSKQKVRALEVTMQISGEGAPESRLERKETKREARDQIMSEIDSLWTDDHEVSAMNMLRMSIKSSN